MTHGFCARFCSCLLLLGLPAATWAQKPTVIPLIPAANWRLVNTQVLELEAVRNYGGDPVVEQEYGVKSLEHRTYRLDNTLAEVIVEAAPDASSAYGLFTYYQAESMTPEKGMQLTLNGPAGALMGRGRFFIRVLRPSGSALSHDNFRALLIFIGGTRPSSAALGNLPAPLPKAGRIPGTEKYLLGLEAARRVLPSFRTELLGFPQGAEVQLADYSAGKGRVTFLAITCPTPQTARIQFGAMEKFLGLNQDRGAGSLYGKRAGSFVFLVLNADSAATANKLINQFNVLMDASWDERYPGEKPITLQLLELILANIAFVGILVGFAIVGGVLIVLSRRIAARWFPESSWGHPEESAIIRLNLR